MLDATTTSGTKPAARPDAKRVTQTYSKPFIAHASIGPSCGLARFDATTDQMSVWTHSQGVFPLRDALAKLLGLAPQAIAVHHVQGAGCYGHNGADDAAADAAIIARRLPGAPIRVQWSREDELAASPLSTAMVVTLDAELSASGHPLDWTTEIWGGTHFLRPGAGGGINLLGAEALPHPPARPTPAEVPQAAGGSGTRNATLLYDVPHQTIINHIAASLGPRDVGDARPRRIRQRFCH